MREPVVFRKHGVVLMASYPPPPQRATPSDDSEDVYDWGACQDDEPYECDDER
jgi:hypothetical protein